MKTVMLRATSAIALSLLPATAIAQNFSTARLSDHVKVLSSDAFEGRGPNTRAEIKTVDYITRQFQAAGVQPGGDIENGHRTWTQKVPLLQSQWNQAPQISITAGNQSLPLTQGEQIVVRSPLNGASAVNLANAPLVFVGYGVKAPERGWDDFKGTDLTGKIMVVLVNDPDFEGGEGSFGGKAMTYYGRWTYKYEEGARQGAAGVLVIHETAPASYGWNTVKNSNTNTMFDIVRDKPSASHPLVEGWVQRDLAQRLFSASGLDLDSMKAAARRKDFRPLPLKAALTVRGDAAAQVITSHNVVGLLPGKKYPDETIIYSAHWDHLGIGKPDANGDAIYNGAVDNATGISMLIEQARAFAHEPRPDRSIVFLAVTAEEKGLLGSEYYATHPLYPAGKTVAVLNTDAMGIAGRARDFSISGTARLDLLDDLVAEAKSQGRYFRPDAHPESGGFYRSDHFTMAKAGIPALSFESGSDLVNGGTARAEALSQDYVTHRYHQPDDEWSPDWDFSGMAQDGQLLHRLGLRLANSREWPNWSADSEFRATRDKTAGDRLIKPAKPVTKGQRG